MLTMFISPQIERITRIVLAKGRNNLIDYNYLMSLTW